ncbi:hypothetical protein LCGC14_0282510 [marine sediment metagenome]|uniref:Uncharacterized protein n=1 Tax=marine sediment metagenome TaxID=412755 RepID=A0A0F9UCG7_9ZZZZ
MESISNLVMQLNTLSSAALVATVSIVITLAWSVCVISISKGHKNRGRQ